jgi:hypothetical protein
MDQLAIYTGKTGKSGLYTTKFINRNSIICSVAKIHRDRVHLQPKFMYIARSKTPNVIVVIDKNDWWLQAVTDIPPFVPVTVDFFISQDIINEQLYYGSSK